jgi:hypothetical protein
METVADHSSEAALDSPTNMGGETGTRLLRDQVKVPKPLEDAVPESAGEVVSPSGSVEEAPTGPNTQLGSLQPAAVVNKHRGRRLAVRRIFSDYNRPWGWFCCAAWRFQEFWFIRSADRTQCADRPQCDG